MTSADVLERRAGADRRVRTASFRYPERRTGFDRRSPGSGLVSRIVQAYRNRTNLIAWCVAGIVALNMVDLLLTWQLIGNGASEANPVMARLFSGGFAAAALLKGAVTLVVASGIWLLRRYRRILEFSLVALVLLTLLVVYEVVGLVAFSG